MEPGYEKATDQNMPCVDDFMLIGFFRDNPDFNAPELRNVKTSRATRESYGDHAVGYVQLKRQSGCCFMKARITPEHKVRKSPYHVELIVDEDKSIVSQCRCIDCPASEGGCKHAIAFLLWVYRKSSRPSVTETECYWKKSKLAQVGSSIKYVTLKDLAKKAVPNVSTVDSSDFFQEALTEGRRRNSSGNLLLEKYPSDCISSVCIHKLFRKFKEENSCHTADGFIKYLQHNIQSSVCKDVEKQTSGQFKMNSWYKARYGRITASNLWEASKCKVEGTLTAKILGSCQPVVTAAIQRGRDLEKDVLHEFKRAYEIKKMQEECGIFICEKYPIFGASPDGLTKTHSIEIKCPSKEGRVKDFMDDDGTPTKKPYAQVQLQMLLTGRKQAFYVVAMPDFERSKAFHVSEVDFNETYVHEIMSEAKVFWEKYVFPHL